MQNTYAIVVAVVRHKEKLLLLKRTGDRKTSPNLWGFVSGYMKERESGEAAALREIKEEINLEGKIAKRGIPFEVTDHWARWIILPFLIDSDNDNITLDKKEHSAAKWVTPVEISEYECVKNINKDLEALDL